MVGRIIFGLIGIPLGTALMVYNHKVVDNFTGPIGFAERYLGSAGTYSFIRILGAVIAIVSMLIMFGLFGTIYEDITGTLKNITP
jgi:uncharacterized membrane protein YkgB